MTKKEREYYNIDRDRTCETLGIDENQYNWLRRKGKLLRKVYEDNCNGIINEDTYNTTTSMLYAHTDRYVEDLGLYVYYQTDCRGATIYLDYKPIPRNNYTNAHCIY